MSVRKKATPQSLYDGKADGENNFNFCSLVSRSEDFISGW